MDVTGLGHGCSESEAQWTMEVSTCGASDISQRCRNVGLQGSRFSSLNAIIQGKTAKLKREKKNTFLIWGIVLNMF